MKIELDEQTIDNICNYIIEHPKKAREIMKIAVEEALSILNEKKILEEGAKLYRRIQSNINYLYKHEE